MIRYDEAGITVMQGDSREVIPDLVEQFDAVVCDPPAGISFMGKNWDGDKGGRKQWIAWMTEIMKECLQVVKPGGHALVWALPRTSHWTATAIEDAGWDVRDIITHHFGQGFPKSLDISKQLDKVAGVERKVVGRKTGRSASPVSDFRGAALHAGGPVAGAFDASAITAPATDAAKQYQGYGTALKPASEHWILARRPLEGTVATNVLKHGTGGLNIDGCRVGLGHACSNTREGEASAEKRYTEQGVTNMAAKPGQRGGDPKGRWPANLLHDGSEEVISLFPQSKGQQGKITGTEPSSKTKNDYGEFAGRSPSEKRGDSGSAARFFYCAKASKRERGASNDHSTVKPLSLMRYLCRLVTPPGGLILDPFAGSGSTLLAAREEGFRAIGIEQDAHYCDIAVERLSKSI